MEPPQRLSRRGIVALLLVVLGLIAGRWFMAQAGEATRITQRLQQAALSFESRTGETPTIRDQRVEHEVDDLFEPDAGAWVAGTAFPEAGVHGIARGALKLAHAFAETSIRLERPVVRVDGRSAEAEFDAVYTGNEGDAQRVDRRSVRLSLAKSEAGAWRISRVEIAGPDEADPEARP